MDRKITRIISLALLSLSAFAEDAPAWHWDKHEQAEHCAVGNEWKPCTSTTYVLVSRHRILGYIFKGRYDDYWSIMGSGRDSVAISYWDDLDAAKEEARKIFLPLFSDLPSGHILASPLVPCGFDSSIPCVTQ